MIVERLQDECDSLPIADLPIPEEKADDVKHERRGAREIRDFFRVTFVLMHVRRHAYS